MLGDEACLVLGPGPHCSLPCLSLPHSPVRPQDAVGSLHTGSSTQMFWASAWPLGKPFKLSKPQYSHYRVVVGAERAQEGECHLLTVKCGPMEGSGLRGCPLTWVTALVKPAISREVCRSCLRVSASFFTRARCSSTVRSRSCTLGPRSVSACSHRTASCRAGPQPAVLSCW